MDVVLQRINILKAELRELMEEFDAIDHTYFARYNRVRDAINDKAQELNLLETSLRKLNTSQDAK